VSAPDFVAIGHVTLDRFPDGLVRPGGSALYAAVTAHRLGLSAGILTSHADDFPLHALPPQIEIVSVEAPQTTVFEHEPRPAGRLLRVAGTARALGPDDVPEDWRGAGLVLLTPVLSEVDPMLASAFPDASIAASAQGWLRGVGREGGVFPQPWTPPRELLERVQALFASTEDVRGHESEVLEWVQRMPVAAITAGSAGALLYVNGDRYEVRPRRARAADETGPGDVFAAAFLIAYHEHGDPWDAAAAATCAASRSVEGLGWSAVPDAAELGSLLGAYRGARV
jgi:sugar/nucleoside kinase (ribokinase family)